MNSTNLSLLELGKRICQRRKQLGMTQETLAEKGDVTTQFVSYAEAGKRAMRPENLLKISSALGVSADYLLTGELIDKDYLLLSHKLQKLSAIQLHIIEEIVDNCIQLYEL
jgi:transcriptional regulator with XRE-family HTH domain